MEGKIPLFGMPAMGGRGVILLPKVNSPAHPNKQTVTASVGFLGSSTGKDSTRSAGDTTSTSASGRSPGEGIGYLLQYSHLENPIHRGAWQAKVHGITKLGHDLVNKPPPMYK